MTRVERLEPGAGALTVPEALAAAELGCEAPPDRPHVVLNMIATLDGRAAVNGRTQALGDEADLATLLELRTLADAVLIGTGTLRAEGYARLLGAPQRRARREAAGRAPDPLAVLLSRGLDLPWDAGLFAAPDQPVLVYTGARERVPAGLAAPVEVVRLDPPAPAAALRDLRRRGVRALLCEGGPTLNRALLADGLVDELFLTLAPVLTGDDAEPTIVAGGALPAAVALTLRWVLRHGDELLLRYALAGS